MVYIIEQQNKQYGSVLLRCTSGSLIADVSNERVAFIFKRQRVHDGGTFFLNFEQQLPYMSLFFWVLTLNIWVSKCRRFEWTHRLYLQGSLNPRWRHFLQKRRASNTLLLRLTKQESSIFSWIFRSVEISKQQDTCQTQSCVDQRTTTCHLTTRTSVLTSMTRLVTLRLSYTIGI